MRVLICADSRRRGPPSCAAAGAGRSGHRTYSRIRRGKEEETTRFVRAVTCRARHRTGPGGEEASPTKERRREARKRRAQAEAACGGRRRKQRGDVFLVLTAMARSEVSFLARETRGIARGEADRRSDDCRTKRWFYFFFFLVAEDV